MPSYSYLHLDVFTARRFEGNQLAVFPDAAGLDTATMQRIAREINFAETTFVLAPEIAGTDARMRIFTPGAELPIAGHPTVGSTFALALLGRIDPSRERFVFGLNIGPTPVALTWKDQALSFAWMTQPTPTFGAPVSDAATLAAVLGLEAADLCPGGLPAEVGSSGVPFLYVPIASRRAVDAIGLRRDRLDALVATHGPDVRDLFVFSAEPAGDEASAYSRMFAPGLGVSEDPATGIASGPLGAYLVRHGLVAPERARAIVSLQGVRMGRPSRIHIEVDATGKVVHGVRVGGQAVLVAEGRLHV